MNVELFAAVRRDLRTGTSGRLIDEHGMHGVSYQVVRGYVAERKPKIRAEAGRGPVEVFLRQTHRPGEEAEVDYGRDSTVPIQTVP